MRAFVLSDNGPALVSMPQPKPKPREVLVRVCYAALNRANVGMAKGRMYGSIGGPGTTLGSECAGEVVEIGSAVDTLQVGDRVMCSTTGAFAEYALVDCVRAYKVPETLGLKEASVLPTALSTMHNAVITEGRLKRGQSVLIYGGSSGVGLMAAKIARLVGASRVIATSRDAVRREQLKPYADVVVDPREAGRFADSVLKATDGIGVDLAIDQVSGNSVNTLMAVTRLEGTIINVGRLGGQQADFDFDLHALRRIRYIGVTFRTRTVEETGAISEAVRRDLWDKVTAGELKLPIDRTFPFEKVEEALAFMAADQHFGKIVIEVRPGTQ